MVAIGQKDGARQLRQECLIRICMFAGGSRHQKNGVVWKMCGLKYVMLFDKPSPALPFEKIFCRDIMPVNIPASG
jgi:hypothetical protein